MVGSISRCCIPRPAKSAPITTGAFGTISRKLRLCPRRHLRSIGIVAGAIIWSSHVLRPCPLKGGPRAAPVKRPLAKKGTKVMAEAVEGMMGLGVAAIAAPVLLVVFLGIFSL